MAQPYIGEIRMFAGNFPPSGWMFCEGQTIPIYEYENLFNLIGTTYGGNGQTNFALPDMRGRLPLHQGNDYIIGEIGGVESVNLTSQQIPSHRHVLVSSGMIANTPNPSNNFLAPSSSRKAFSTLSELPQTNMNAGAVDMRGEGQRHSNMQPYLCVNFIISLYGIFPSWT